MAEVPDVEGDEEVNGSDPGFTSLVSSVDQWAQGFGPSKRLKASLRRLGSYTSDFRVYPLAWRHEVLTSGGS